jgi:amino acid adenylation domain-containing protein
MINRESLQFQLLKNLKKFAHSTAVEYGDIQVTYEELENKSRCVFHRIMAQGIKKGTFIGICLENRVEITAALIGILRAGCVFMILETGLPPRRIKRMMELTGTRVLICDPAQKEKLFAHSDFSITRQKIQTLVMDEGFYRDPQPAPLHNPVNYHPEDNVYVYFTSGSTGEPRAIIGKNKSLLHFIRWEIHTFGIDRTFRVSQFTNPGFDAFLRDILVPLFSGAVICIPPNNDMPIHDGLIRWIDRSCIHLIHCVPSIFRLFNTEQLERRHFKSLRYVLLSGESIMPGELKNWYRTFGKRIQLVNFYGPTETTMIKTCYFIKSPDVRRNSIPIGKPMKGAQVVICDKNLTPCDPGITGEVYIRTPFSTNGYCNDPETTRRYFLPNPFSKMPGDFLYRTGDLARELPDGDIELRGRSDRQVKIRGIRVQLEEIEYALMQHQKVDKAVVVEKQNHRENYLCAYVVLEASNRFTPRNEKNVRRPDPITPGTKGPLTGEEKTRYQRQIMLDGWGEESQGILKQTTVFAAGAGGSGSPLIMQLALQGFGTIIVCDYDTVEPSNLNRQCLHDLSRLHMNKALSARMTVEKLNPYVTVVPRTEKITEENVDELVGDAAVIFDNVDDMETKFILSRHAIKKQIPHIISSMMDINAYAAVFYPPHSPCFHCLYDRELVNRLKQLRTEADGVETTPLASTSSSLFLSTGFAVTEALKILLGLGKPAYNKFFLFNQKGSNRIAGTDGYRLVTFPFSTHFRESVTARGFDWENGWTGNFLEEFTVYPDPGCTVCRQSRETSLNRLSNTPDSPAPVPITPGNNHPQTHRDKKSTSTVITELRDYLTGKLPYYMIPAYFVPMDHIPLGSSGKIERRQLPDPQNSAVKTYVPPGSETEKKLVEIWSEVLEIEKRHIGIETGFFEIGGHSLKATVMMSMVNKAFNVSLPLAEVFRQPTIKHLAHCLEEHKTGPAITLIEDENLVLLRKGTDPGKNLFLVHAGNGEVEGYIQFANLLKPDFNYWGLRADRIKNYTPRQRRMEDIAAKYIKKIKKIQPGGHYYIAGWCLGGPISFEMIYQLEQQQQKIGFFALIDSGAPLRSFYTLDINDFTIESEFKMIADFFQDSEMIKPLEKLNRWEQFWPGVLDYLETMPVDIEMLKQAISTHVPGKRRGIELEVIPHAHQISMKELIYYFNQIRSLRNARARYTPRGKISTLVHYFEASESRSKREFADPWKDLCHQPLRCYEVEGGHFSIFEIPAVAHFAGQFNIF